MTLPPTTPPRRPRNRLSRRIAALSPKQMLVILAVIIFVAELADMLLIDLLPPLGGVKEALLDSCVLLLLLSPAYFFLYKPFWEERQRTETEIRRLSRRLIRGEEATRKALARDLHDEFGQTLGALQLGIETLRNSLPADAGPAADQCRRLSLMIADLGAHVRNVTAQLRPGMIDSLGLVPTLRWHLRQFQERHPAIRVIIDMMDDQLSVPTEAAVAMYRVCQEGLNNVVKHARARQVTVALRSRDGTLVLTIEDDGVGFVPNGPAPPGREFQPGIGLTGMQERLADAGGRLLVDARPGGGTRLTATLPLPPGGTP